MVNSGGRLLVPTGLERIPVPSKATKEADWDAQLPLYIAQMGEDPRLLQPAVSKLHQMRQDCRGAPASNVGVDVAVQYYRQLDSLSRRLPLAEAPLTVSFIWYDAFDQGSCAKQSSMAFEKANVLFNIGAIFSQLEGPAEAARGLQCAASVFSYIADNFLHPPLADIRRSSLMLLSSLMLAQAQELAVGKAAQGEKSASTLSKLSASAAKFYAEIRSSLASPDAAEMRSSLFNYQCANDLDAYSIVQVKAGLWGALAEYYKGEACYKETRIGEAIARLKRSEATVQASLDSGEVDNASNIGSFMNSLVQDTKARIAVLEKENTMVYNQSVPEDGALPPVEDVSVVQVANISDCLSGVPERPELFASLVPLRIHEEMSKYSEEKAKLLRYESMKVATADTELQATLTSFGFPKALEDAQEFCGGNTVPREVAALCTQAQALPYASRSSGLRRALDDASSLIDESGALLDGEISDFQKARIRHGAAFEQTPSHLGNAPLFEKLAELQELQSANLSSFGRVLGSIGSEDQQYFECLCGPGEQLGLIVPAISSSVLEEARDLNRQVEAQLDELEGLSRGRARHFDNLKDAILADDISSILITSKTLESSAIFHKELAKFDNVCQSIEENVSRHGRALESLKTTWAKLQQLKSVASSSRLDGPLAKMRHAYNVHEAAEHEMRQHAGEIERARVAAQQLHGNIVSFVEGRTAERSKIEQDIQVSKAHQGQAYLLDKLKKSTLRNQVKSPVQQQHPETVQAHYGQMYLPDHHKSGMQSQIKSPAPQQSGSVLAQASSGINMVAPATKVQPNKQHHSSATAGPSMEPSLLD